MNKSGDLGSLSGQLTSIPKKAADQLVKEPVEAVEAVEEQAGVKPTVSQKPSDDNKQVGASDSTDMTSNKATLEIIKKMYEASDVEASVPSDKTISAVIEENPKKKHQRKYKKWQQQDSSFCSNST